MQELGQLYLSVTLTYFKVTGILAITLSAGYTAKSSAVNVIQIATLNEMIQDQGQVHLSLTLVCFSRSHSFYIVYNASLTLAHDSVSLVLLVNSKPVLMPACDASLLKIYITHYHIKL